MGALDLQGVVRQCLDRYRQDHWVSPRQQQVLTHILQCRTEALGGLEQRCDRCGYEQPQYHSCRDRHCPKCQRKASQAWSEKQKAYVLPVDYYHLVFTLPHALNGWVQLHPEVLYRLLFQCVWATLSAFGADPKRLDGQLGMTAVLHTWGRNLSRHVHLHCLVPGGALGTEGDWHPARSTYLFPIQALSRHFRGRMVSALRHSRQAGDLSRITRPGEVDAVLNALMRTEWVVYSKACLGDAEHVVEYLSDYSHRIALTDGRLEETAEEGISLRYKDYRDRSRWKMLKLTGEELIRRFLLHILPKGFMRIRHYGFLANRCRQDKLQQIRLALAVEKTPDPVLESVPTHPDPVCPRCHRGSLKALSILAPKRTEGG